MNRTRVLNIVTISLMAVIVVLLSISSFIIFTKISEQENDGIIIKLAERQRTIDMNITQTVDAIIKFDKNATYRKTLEDSLRIYLHDFEKAHNALQHGDENLGFSKVTKSKKLDSLFKAVKPSYSNILQQAGKIINDSVYHKFGILNELIIAQSQFLPLMNKVVAQYTVENQKRQNSVKETLKFTSFLIVFILLVEAVFVIISVSKISRQQKLLKQQKVDISKKAKKLQFAHNEMAAQNEEIRQQNEEILTVNEHLEDSKAVVSEQNDKLKEVNQEILHGINYAAKMQESLLASPRKMKAILKDYFLLFKPKDIISGDFYYVKKVSQYNIYAVADCTGHGVSGGFLSVLGIKSLNEILRISGITTAAEVLTVLRSQIKSVFKEFGSNSQNGMDIALCMHDTNTDMVTFAGAYNPLYIIRENELIIYKATRNPIGNYPKEISFKSHEIQLQKNDILYLFSDGYVDQFNEDYGKKISKKRFRNILLENHKLPMNEQKQKLESFLNDWQGLEEQIDDIAVLGIKI
ncbi:MAG: SpoIIE family protein phosphatase [Bacteroidota bacterium]|nr:SpoIIE family protein phosphatase [Bacteroidota bacterium]